MTRYGRLRENEKALRVMTLEEERRLVQKVMEENLIIGVMSVYSVKRVFENRKG